MHKAVNLFLINFMTLGLVYGQSYTYNCSGTFQPFSWSANIVASSKRRDVICEWKIDAPPGDWFLLNFIFPEKKELVISSYFRFYDGYSRQRNIYESTNIVTRSNFVRILLYHEKYVNIKTSGLFKVQADMVTKRLEYSYHNETKLTWSDAQMFCERDGGTLAEILPVRPSELMYGINLPNIWSGLSVTQWKWAHGCVYWPNPGGIAPVYSKSKYNQMSECSLACPHTEYFLLRDSFCYCLDKIVTTKKAELQSCNIKCNGDDKELCGGRDKNTYMLYERYKGPSVEGLRLQDCMWTSANLTFIPTECDRKFEFTCEFINGSFSHFYDNLTWLGAWEFCGNLPGSVGLKDTPKLTSAHNKQWTSVFRKMDWNYPTITRRNPEYSFTDRLKKSSETQGFTCQHKNITCGEHFAGENGTIDKFDIGRLYGIYEYCIWDILVPEGMNIQIDITDMDLEDSDKCVYDYIQIWDFPAGDKRRFCGTNTPQPFISETSAVEIVFNSDRSNTRYGFRLEWKAVKPTIEIDESLERKKGLSGGGVVAITLALTVTVLALVAFVIILRIRRSRLTKNQNIPAASVGGMSNAIYSDSVGNSSEFSSVSNAYQNVPERRIAPAYRAFCQSIDVDHTGYENMEKSSQDQDHHPKLESVTEDTSAVHNMSDIETLGLDSINVVDTDDRETNPYSTPYSNYYSTIPDDNTVPMSDAAREAQHGNTDTLGYERINVYNEVNIPEDDNGYLEPRSPHAVNHNAVYSEVL